MAETVVGLFAHPEAADAVTAALLEIGIQSGEIRALVAPKGASVSGPTGTPQLDFEAALARDLRSMGARESEIEAYVAGLRGGNVLIFATGTTEQAHSAIDVMNSHAAIEVEEFAGSVPVLPGNAQGFSGAHSISAKEDRVRAKTDGARLFVW